MHISKDIFKTFLYKLKPKAWSYLSEKNEIRMDYMILVRIWIHGPFRVSILQTFEFINNNQFKYKNKWSDSQQ